MAGSHRSIITIPEDISISIHV